MKHAEAYMRCYRPEDTRKRDALVVKAARFAERDESLRPVFEQQLAFDRSAMSRVAGIDVPEGVAREISELVAARKSGVTWKHPAVLSVVFSVLLIAGVVGWFWYQELDAFDGRGAAEKMVERTQRMTGRELEKLDTKSGDLKDWMFMKNIDGFAVPPDFSDYHVVGGRVFHDGGFPVVQLAVEENEMFFFLFRLGDFDMKLRDGEGWRVFAVDDWVAAVRASGDLGFMIAFPGTRAEMNAILKSIRR